MLEAAGNYSILRQPFTVPAGAFGNYPIIGPIPDQDTTLASIDGPYATVSVAFTQPILQQVRTGLIIDQHELDDSLASQNLRSKQQDIVKQVKQQYYEILKTKQRPDVQEKLLRLKQAETGARITKSEYIPALNFVMQFTQLFNVDFVPPTLWSVGLQLRRDIWDWGRKSNDLTKKRAEIAQAANDLDDTKAQVTIEVDSRIRDLEEAQEMVKVTEITQTAATEKPSNPERLKEMQKLFPEQAAANHALPLDDRVLERTNAETVGRPDLMNGRKSLTVYPGMIGLTENVFINTKNKSHTITAEVTIPKGGANGVIIAQAGRFGGWSLYLKDGKPVYAYNFLGLSLDNAFTGKIQKVTVEIT